MFLDSGDVYLEDEDQCTLCVHASRNCPLLEALASGVAFLCQDGALVTNCGFFKRMMRVVE